MWLRVDHGGGSRLLGVGHLYEAIHDLKQHQ
jgi:hypothetical protein